MADQKISGLTAGTPGTADTFPFQRGGTNNFSSTPQAMELNAIYGQIVGTPLATDSFPFQRGGTNVWQGIFSNNIAGKIQSANGTTYPVGTLTDTQYLQVSGGSIISSTVSSGGGAGGEAGRLTLSGTVLSFAPYKGNGLMINGVTQTIPSTGVTLAPTGLAASTTYYIYSYMNGTAMTLEAGTNTYTVDSTYGNEIKSGDATRSLVGMARTTAGTAWADSSNQMFVLSWFNRQSKGGQDYFTANKNLTTTAAWAEIDTEIRVEFLTWGTESVQLGVGGAWALNSAGGDAIYVAIGIDGTTPEEGSAYAQATAAILSLGLSKTKSGLSEGYHYATLLSYEQTGSGGGAITGSATAGKRTTLSVGIRG